MQKSQKAQAQTTVIEQESTNSVYEDLCKKNQSEMPLTPSSISSNSKVPRKCRKPLPTSVSPQPSASS